MCALTLMQRRVKADADIREAGRNASKLRMEAVGVGNQISALEADLAREGELEQKHTAYEENNLKLTELEAKKPDYDKWQAVVTAAEREISEMEQKHDREAGALDQRIKVLREKVSLLENSGCPHPAEAHCRFLEDALKAQKELPGVEANRQDLEAEYEEAHCAAVDGLRNAETLLEEVGPIPDQIAAVASEIRLLMPLENAYQQLAQKKETLRMLLDRKTDIEARIAEAEKAEARAKEDYADIQKQVSETAEGMEAYNALRTEIQRESRWLEQEKHLPVEREREATARKRIDELDGEVASLEADIREAQAEKTTEERKTEGVEELQRQVAEADRKIAEANRKAQAAIMRQGELNGQLKDADEKRRQAGEIRAQVNSLGSVAAGYETLKQAFSQDGIPHNVIRSIIPVFEATATNILGQMSQGHMSVEFVTEKTLKSNKGKEVTTLDIIINDSVTGRLPYASRSGGERVKAALSVILALAEIKSTKAGIQLGFLFIDEPPFLDQEGVQAYCDALETIQQRYEGLKVMAITHDPAMKSRFPQSLDVVKTAEGSKVIYE